MPDRYSSISIDSPSRPQASKPNRPRRKRESFLKKTWAGIPKNPFVIAGLLMVIFIGIYCLGGFFLVPALIKKNISRYLDEHTDMALNIGDVRFNPFTFQLGLADLKIRNESGSPTEAPFLTLSDLAMDLTIGPLFRGDFVCTSFRADQMAVTLIRYPDNTYNFSQLLGTSKANTPATLSDLLKFPFLFSINNISITNSSLIFDDRVLNQKHTVEKIMLTLPAFANFSYQSKATVSPSFSAVINGSPIQLTGEASMPGSTGGEQTRVSFDLHDLDLPMYFNYLPPSFPLKLVKGTADGQLQVSFIPKKDNSKRLTVFFQIDARDTEVATRDKSLDIMTPTARLEGEFQPFTGNIHFQNILMHEPKVSLDSNFSEKSLDSLLPSRTATSSGTLDQRSSPLFAVDLFIMDNGVLNIEDLQNKKKHEKTYRSLQLSIKNYSNKVQTEETGKNEECSFKLSGEQLAPPASFSWQGKINEKNQAEGTLQLNRFPASLLSMMFTSEEGATTSGTADMTGILSMRRNPGASKPFSYTISDGEVKISDLRLSEAGNEWLHAGSFKLGPLDSKGNTFDIGNIYVRNAALTLRQNHLPRLIDALVKKGSRYKLHGVDFAGNIILKPAGNARSSLILKDISLQANNLASDAKDKDNFALTGKTGDSGEIKAKGPVSLNPFRALLTVQFSGMQANELLPWYTDSSFLSDGKAQMEGMGQLIYPSGTFKGSLVVSNALFTDKQSKSSFAWDKADFQDFDFTPKPFHLNIASVQIDHPILNYTQTDNKKSALLQASNFFRELFPPAETGKSSKEPASPDLEIKAITMADGTAIYKDIRLVPPWQQEIAGFSGRIQNISRSATSSPAEYSFTGTLSGRRMTLSGTMDLFADKLFAQSTLSVSGVPIALYKAQLTPLLSLDTDKGSFDLTLMDVVQKGHETGEAQYLFHGLSPISPSSDTALPLALLADKNDTFTAHVPLTGTEEQQPVLSDTVTFFKRLIVKSLVAPLLLTNDNFSRLASDDTPDFIPGKKVLTEKGKAKLTLYKDLLDAHPRLGIEIFGMADLDSDKKVLQQDLTEAENKRVEEENKRRAREWNQLNSQKSQTGQQKTIVEKNIPPDLLAKYAPIFPKKVIVSDQDMQNLATQRTTSAYDFFTQQLGLNPDRIIKHSTGSPKPVIWTNRVGITLHSLASPNISREPPAKKPE